MLLVYNQACSSSPPRVSHTTFLAHPHLIFQRITRRLRARTSKIGASNGLWEGVGEKSTKGSDQQLGRVQVGRKLTKMGIHQLTRTGGVEFTVVRKLYGTGTEYMRGRGHNLEKRAKVKGRPGSLDDCQCRGRTKRKITRPGESPIGMCGRWRPLQVVAGPVQTVGDHPSEGDLRGFYFLRYRPIHTENERQNMRGMA